MFAATEKLMVCDPLLFLGFLLNYLTIRSQASGDYDLGTEISIILTPLNKDTELLKDVAVAACVRVSRNVLHTFLSLFSFG